MGFFDVIKSFLPKRSIVPSPVVNVVSEGPSERNLGEIIAEPPKLVLKPATQEKPKQYRKWRLTYYLISEQASFTGIKSVPILDETGKSIISVVEASFFSYTSLQGTGKMRDGRLINVSGKYIPVKHSDYAPVLEYHKSHMSKRPFSYSGIQVENDIVVKALAFHAVPPDKMGNGYGIIRGVPFEPFKTVAADIGTSHKADPRYKGKGGLVPPLTKIHIKELTGIKLPDGTEHSGWVTANDSGGGIFGAHCDLFVGVQSLKNKVKLPGEVHIWFEGIEDRVPEDYQYGLKDV